MGKVVSHGWDITASVEHVEERRIIVYNLEEAIYTGGANLSSITLFCIEACKSLLKELKDDKDRVFVEHEIALLRQTQVQWQMLQEFLNKRKPSQ